MPTWSDSSASTSSATTARSSELIAPRVGRCGVLERELDPEPRRAAEPAPQRASLGGHPRAQAGGRGGEPGAVEDEQIGAGDRRVAQRAVELGVGLDGARDEVVGGVEDEPQPAQPEPLGQRPRVGTDARLVDEHRARRSVDLHVRAASGLVGLEPRHAGPPAGGLVDPHARDRRRRGGRLAPR
jgi:hypothetical protein